MSIQQTTNGKAKRVSKHAREKFLARVDGSEPFPKSRIEQEFREAERVELVDGGISDGTKLHPESGVVYVFDETDRTVITCFIPEEHHEITEQEVPQ